MEATTTNARRIITAFFEDRSAAERAIGKLTSAGLPRDQIRLVPGYESTGTDTEPREIKGFWESLADFFLPDEDRYTYAEGLRRGGYVVSVTVSAEKYDDALSILDDEGTIDMDERASEWRATGWEGYRDTSSLGSAASAGSTEEVIPVTEERLQVGKRDVSHGRVRVRSYVVETPVSEDVRLRQEDVTVERRPVNRPATGDEKLFKDRTIEVTEHSEEAVVAKEARVKEELVVKKKVDERVEHVSDKVRRTEVEVEDERGASAAKTKRRTGT
jgi:uncharacterized protein (TIGR02271 family)